MDTDPGPTLAYAIERILSKVRPPAHLNGGNWAEECRWAISEVQDGRKDSRLLAGLYFNDEIGMISWRGPK